MPVSLPYVVMVLFYAALAFVAHYKSDETIRFRIDGICILVFLFFFGLRGFVGYDWSSYYPEFTHSPELSYLFATPLRFWRWEPGYTIFFVIFHSICPSWPAFVLTFAVIDIILLVRFFRKFSISLPLGLMVFMAMYGTSMVIDTMRNSVSILLFANALPYLIERKPLPYFLLCLLGASFHASGLLYLPLYFFLHRKINKWVLLGLFFAACVVYVFKIPVVKSTVSLIAGIISPSFKQKIDEYLTFDVGGAILSIGFLERLFSGIMTFLFIDRLRDVRKGNDVFINSLFLLLILNMTLSEFRTISMRISGLFAFSYWIIWPDLIQCFRYHGNKVLYVIFLFAYSILKVSTTGSMLKYENVLFPHMNYNERLIYFSRHFYDDK